MSDQDQIRLAEITKGIVDGEQILSHQISYLGKVANGIVFYPYGFHANAPPESWALMLSIEGHSESRALLVSEPKVRPKLKPGEVALYSPLIPGLIITLQADKQLSIKSPVKVFVDAPEAEFISNVKITGNLEVVGSTKLSSTVTSGGKDISDSHSHTGSPTAPSGAISDTGEVT